MLQQFDSQAAYADHWEDQNSQLFRSFNPVPLGWGDQKRNPLFDILILQRKGRGAYEQK